MSRILAIDLGKFKSVTCLLDSDTNQTEFWTMSTDRQYLLAVLKNYHPDLVVIESCGLAGWVHDICTEEGYEVLVCNPNQEAWKWKHINARRIATMRSSWLSWPRWGNWCPSTFRAASNANIAGW